jgi:protein ImuB
MACVDLPAFPLQLLLQRHPDWQGQPVAVVDRDAPQGRLLWVNERARSAGILPGMRFVAALSLAGGLRAGEVPPNEIRQAGARLTRRLRNHTPRVEASTDEPGIFWLDGTGLQRLFPSWRRWAARLQNDLKQRGFSATVVVGFDRFGTYALARARPGAILVLPDPAAERRAARDVPLHRVAVEPASRELLAKLGITTVGQLIDLPAEGIERRFEPSLAQLHRLASGAIQRPLLPEQPAAPARRQRILEPPEVDAARLLAVIEQLLHPVLETVAGRAASVAEVRLRFHFERLGDHLETLRPAAPTRDARQILDLIRLRLAGLKKLPDAVAEIVLSAREALMAPLQASLLARRPRRDLAAANRALARVRAEIGDDTVRRARLRAGHLPEGSFAWEPLDSLSPPRPRDIRAHRLVRRLRIHPLPLPPRGRREPDGWMLRGLDHGPVVRLHGPYIVSGGWWSRAAHREYHFAELQRGGLLWIYYDRLRRRWFVHGRVE